MNLYRKAAPLDPFITLPDLKLHLRVDHDDEDQLITSLGDAALAHLDGPRGVLGRCIQPQVWVWEGDAPSGKLRLPLPDVSDVTAYDMSDPAAPVALEIEPRQMGRFCELSLDAPAPVSIEFTAQTPSDVWPVIRTAILLLVGHWYENREAVALGATSGPLPIGVDRLLSPLKLRWM